MMKNIKSMIFVPAVEKRLAKIGKMHADAYIIDLEDSIAQNDKDRALHLTADFLKDCKETNIFIRINRDRFMQELEILDQFKIGFMLPKIQTVQDYAEAAECFMSRSIIALIETPLALLNAGSIASIPWVTALAFGAEDFTVAANMMNETNNLFVAKSILAIAAKASNKRVYDTPCFELQSEQSINTELEMAVNLGYDGKLAIHPKQVELINRAFGIYSTEHLRYLIETYEKSGQAVCEIDGRVYEKLHIDRFRRMLSSDERSADS